MILLDNIVGKIFSIKLPIDKGNDCLIWEPNSNDLFSTASCYNLIESDMIPTKSFSWIWEVYCPNKLKILLWKCYHNRLPCRSYLHHIGMNFDKVCTICSNDIEDIPHIFIHCFVAKIFWHSLNLSINWPKSENHHWLDRLRFCNPTIPSKLITWSQLFLLLFETFGLIGIIIVKTIPLITFLFP